MDTSIISIIVTMCVVTIIVLALRVLYCHRLFKSIISIIVTMCVVTIIVLALRVLYCHRLFKSLKGLRIKMKTQHEQLMQGIDSLKVFNAGLYETTSRKAPEHQYDSTLKPLAEHHYETANRPLAEHQYQYSSLAVDSGDPYQVIPADEKKIKT